MSIDFMPLNELRFNEQLFELLNFKEPVVQQDYLSMHYRFRLKWIAIAVL